MRSGDHDEVAGRQQLVHPFHTPDVLHHPRHTARQRIDTQHSHAKPRRTTTDLGSDRTDSHHPHRAIGQVQVARINPADPARSTQEVRPLGLAPDRCPRSVDLLPQINVQIAGEGQHVTHHVVGNHVVEQAAHVGQSAGVSDQFVEDVVFETGRWRLHPFELTGDTEQLGSDFPEERRRVDDLTGCRLGVRRVDHLHLASRLTNPLETRGVDGWMNDKFHHKRTPERDFTSIHSGVRRRWVRGQVETSISECQPSSFRFCRSFRFPPNPSQSNLPHTRSQVTMMPRCTFVAPTGRLHRPRTSIAIRSQLGLLQHIRATRHASRLVSRQRRCGHRPRDLGYGSGCPGDSCPPGNFLAQPDSFLPRRDTVL